MHVGQVSVLLADTLDVAYVDNRVVGAICCRLEPMAEDSLQLRTYIMTLGVLEPYRHKRIGSMLLQSVIIQSIQDGMDHVYLHVQTNNALAIQFYMRFGFEIAEVIKNYYKRIEPPDCYLLARKLLLPQRA